MKRFLIALACLALLLAGCGKSGDGIDAETALSEETEGQADERIYAVKDGAPAFTVLFGSADNSENADYVASMLKTKTGVTFKVANSPTKVSGGNIIYVGLHDSVETMYELYGDSISYDGYGAVYHDGDVYICGYNSTSVSRAAKKFISCMVDKHVVKGEDGKTAEAYFTKEMFFLSNPGYEVKEPKLLGADASDYVLVLGSLPELAVKQVSEVGREMIGKRTGAYVRAVQKSTADTRIELARGADMELFDYKISSSGKTLKIEFGGISALYSAFSELCALTANDTSGGISVEKSARDGILANTSLEAGADVRVMSANVLGTKTGSGYECPTEVRAAIMAEYILAHSPDSVGFQEFYGDVASIIKSDLAKKYRTVDFGGGMTATMYLKDKYTVVDKNVISTRVEETAGDSKAQNYTFTWVLLEDAEGERYIHANLHLEYRSDALRLEQCDMINAELDKVLAKYPDAALVITGDYNSKISGNSPIFDAIKGKTESDAGLSIECAELCAPEGKRDDDRSSYHSVCSHTDIVTGTPSALDHIMVSTDTVDVKLHKIIYDALICHASDHCPVIIDFARKNV